MKKTKIMICIAVLAIVVVSLYFITQIRRFDETLTAIKVDSNGNQIGTVDISISGVKTNFLGNRRLRTLSIEGFDGNPAMEDVDISLASKKLTQDFYSITYGIATVHSSSGDITDFDNLNANSYACTIAYSEDLDQWLIHIRTGSESGVYYLTSFSGDYTTDELLEYFQDYFRS